MNDNFIKFLGTAGGRVAVFRQLRYSGGMWLSLGGVNILIDPGPGSLIRMFEFGLEPEDINIIVVSHRHLDHSADLNTVVEASSKSTSKPIDMLVAPNDVVYGDDPILLKYLHKGIKDISLIDENTEFIFKNIKIKGTVKHIHSYAETFGIEISTEDKKVVYVPCGKFYEDMLEGYSKGADIEILNTTFPKTSYNYYHLSAEDVKRLLKAHKPQKAVITHFSPYILRENPEKIAEEIQRETSIPTVAAKDGMKIRF